MALTNQPSDTQRHFTLGAFAASENSGIHETVVEVLQGKALRHYAPALCHYLALRLGALDAGASAMGELRAIVAAEPGHKLLQPPGLRAQLYRIARQVWERRRAATGSSAAPVTVPWRTPEQTRLKGFREALDRLRQELSFDEAEILELRYARELSPEEVAFVLGCPTEAVLDRLEAAVSRARIIVEQVRPRLGAHLRQALSEAFALETPPPDMEDDDVWEPLTTGTIVGGRYAIERRVGSGAFADIYRAKDTEVPGHVVALKLLHQPALSEEGKGRALRELHLIASVFHPSIVQFKDHGWHEGRLWFVMPWYDGETLESRIERGPLTRAEARTVFEPLARALAAMHAAGIRHQDVKPENIFLARVPGFRRGDSAEDLLPVLLDLGVAAKERELVIAGTPTYFAPEVAAQFASSKEVQKPVTPRADVFSLALTLRNALEPATQDVVAPGSIDAFIEGRSKGITLPKSRRLRYLRPHFRRWLHVDPLERPTAEQFADELAVLTAPEEKRARRLSVFRWLAPLTVAVAAVFAASVLILSARAERQRLAAERARIAEAQAREHLAESNERRAALERDANALRAQFEESQWTRAQLAEKLAQTEARARRVEADLSASRSRRKELRSALGETQDDLAFTEAQLKDTEAELASARTERDSMTAQAAQLKDRLAHANEKLTTERVQHEQRLGALEAAHASTRARLEAERAKSSQLERSLDAAMAEVAEARAALERAAARDQPAATAIDATEDPIGSRPVPGS